VVEGRKGRKGWLSEFFLELLFRPTGPLLGCPLSLRLLHSTALVVRFRLNLALGHFLHHRHPDLAFVS
jgi:hypothetical protein